MLFFCVRFFAACITAREGCTLKAKNGNGTEGNGAESKKGWNVVVVTLENKGSQKGLLHHLQSRCEELAQACCVYPDLLLKATCTVIGTKGEQLFARFLGELSDDCLVRAFGKSDLQPCYEPAWERVRECLADSDLSELVFCFCTFCRREALLDLVKSFISKPHDRLWASIQEDLQSGDGERWKRAQSIIFNLVQTFLAFDECPTAYFYGDDDWHIDPENLQDPRRPLVISFSKWAFSDQELGSFFIKEVTKVLNLVAVPDRLDRFFEKKAAEEAEIRKEVRRMWLELPNRMGRWVVGGGLTEIEIDFGPNTETFGLEKITIHPEDKTFPAIGIRLEWFVAGVYFVDELSISNDGQINLFDWRSRSEGTDEERLAMDRARGLRLLIYQACAKTLYGYACSLGQDRHRQRKKKRAQIDRLAADGERKVAISPHFPRIGRRGKEPTDKNIKRCLEIFQYEPPKGRTLQMSPPLRGRQTKDDYMPIVLETSIEEV